MKATKRHSGFAALIGRPNAGKSTLLNRLVGEKLAIVSPKPQTTRGRILGVVTRPEGQVAFLDTPGIHEAKGELNRYMVETALAATEEVDLNLFLIEPPKPAQNADRKKATTPKPEITPGNQLVLERLKKVNKPTFLLVNKIDAVEKAILLPLIDLYQKAFQFAEVIPLSARTGEGLDILMQEVLRTLPEGEPLFEEDMLTDQSERALVAEFIREQVLRHCREEVPYAAAVVIDVFDEAEREPLPGKKPGKNGLAGLIRIAATIYVERDSQKAIVIGKRGVMLKTIGTDARATIERFLGTHVYLSLRIKVEPKWSESVQGLRKLGYES